MVCATPTRRDRAAARDPGLERLPAHIRLLASENPLGFEAGDANLYRYVGNNPTNATDPSGLIPAYVPFIKYGEPRPKNWNAKEDWAIVGTGTDVRRDRRDKVNREMPTNVIGGDRVIAPYLQFRHTGGFQDAFRVLPIRTDQVRNGEIGWIVPIYAGRTLYFNKGGNYLGGSGAYPVRGGETVVELKEGMGLIFWTPGDFPPEGVPREFINDEGGPFIRTISPAEAREYKPKPYEVLIIVPALPNPKPNESARMGSGENSGLLPPVPWTDEDSY